MKSPDRRGNILKQDKNSSLGVLVQVRGGSEGEESHLQPSAKASIVWSASAAPVSGRSVGGPSHSVLANSAGLVFHIGG